ncbi:dnaJ homolog subfamily C member 3 [Hylaeus anthracinus]|uniref:dnaJ homolog subfamily C member 3 n=1 Tax=Hylaeus volcanicus TaxID=313075 RepID=UPI0023B7F1C2|nr:dnaJ homolog subfamily C member 3 [Hylaeus volcanicus]XP_054014218.1 dnaJ homolog subfamily C member 3 [Hylaeus anthracinus]
MYHCGLLLVLLDLSLDVVGSVTQLEIDRHLELGKEFLAKGQLQDALSHYHAAVEGDPNNYLTYYKRGTVYLALGKAKFALLDLDKVLVLKPDFTSARLQRGNVLLKQAQFDKAEADFHDVLAVEPHNTDALNALYKIEPAQQALAVAENLMGNGDYMSAMHTLSTVIEVCPWSVKLRELRAECHEALEDFISAISDVRSTTKLQSDNTEGFLKLATLHYRLGQVEESLKEIRECLKLDPEHSKCFSFYKKIKKIAKLLADAETSEDTRDYDGCIVSAQAVFKLEPSIANVRFLAHQLLCKCYTGNSDSTKAIQNCQEALKMRKEPGVYCDSAEAYLAAEMFDDAIRDFKEALEINPSLQRAKQGLHKAQQRQKLSESRDYYKILGVSRTASKRDIIKAYRKAAQKWHPDNFQEGEEKKRAEKRFIDIAAAKEVLTDDEKRAKFDQGEDPLDPESGKHQQGFNPFQEFHHFHGSPFQFKFHFN